VAPWKCVYNERFLCLGEFAPLINVKQIIKRRFNFLPEKILPYFPYREITETFWYFRKINITAFQKMDLLINSCIKDSTIITRDDPLF
jgi:hypothetical protein